MCYAYLVPIPCGGFRLMFSATMPEVYHRILSVIKEGREPK